MRDFESITVFFYFFNFVGSFGQHAEQQLVQLVALGWVVDFNNVLIYHLVNRLLISGTILSLLVNNLLAQLLFFILVIVFKIAYSHNRPLLVLLVLSVAVQFFSFFIYVLHQDCTPKFSLVLAWHFVLQVLQRQSDVFLILKFVLIFSKIQLYSCKNVNLKEGYIYELLYQQNEVMLSNI